MTQDWEIVCYVDPEFVDPDDPPVTVRSTKTRKEVPQSPQEPFTPRLATRGRGRGQGASSEPLGGRNGQNSLDPSSGFPADPEIKITPAEVAKVKFDRHKDRVAGQILADAEAAREEAEKIATGEIQLQELYCANGDHEWTRPAGRRGRKPVNCPQHPNAVDLEANAEERRRKAEARIDNLEMLLMSRGTHIKQQKEPEWTSPTVPAPSAVSRTASTPTRRTRKSKIASRAS